MSLCSLHLQKSALPSTSSICDELVVVASVLVVVDEFLQFVGVDDHVQSARVGQSELTVVDACKTNLTTVARPKIAIRMIKQKLRYSMIYKFKKLLIITPSKKATHLFPRARAVDFACTVDGILVLFEVDERDRQTCKVRNIAVQALRRFVHFEVKAAVSNLVESR